MTDVVKSTDTVRVTIDGVEVDAPKNALVIRVAEGLGIEIPRFCDHPLLAPAGACRQCLVEVEGQRKPVASCTQTVADGMVVRTHLTSPVAKKAQEGIMEMLRINHPLDCRMCNKGGECPLQNQAMSTGRSDTRFHEHKREYQKPINISSQVLLDRERCVLCQRCTRFSEEIAGDPFIDLMERSSIEQIGVYRDDVYTGAEAETDSVGTGRGDEPFNSYFSGNTVQICPVGALTGTQYRFRARPFDLVSSPSTCEHCAAGCALRTDHRRGKVMRRLSGDDPQVNEEWNCDKGRWGFQYANAFDRLTEPLVRDARSGELRTASWSEALSVAAQGLRRSRGVGVLTGGRLTLEDAYAYSKFTRIVLRTNDIDFRARPLSGEEAQFLAAKVAGERITYADVETASVVVIAGLEAEDECPILFLRLRKAAEQRRLPIHVVAPFATRGTEKMNARLVSVAPGGEGAALSSNSALRELLGAKGALLIVGERLASSPGALSAAASLANETGARVAWVPRRAGDRGAVESGCLPNLLPGGRQVDDVDARSEIAERWDLEAGYLSNKPGRDSDGILAAAASGSLDTLIVAGVDPADLSDPRAAEAALDNVGFLISLEIRDSAVARRADVVFPVAPMVEKVGTYMNWEGRTRTFEAVLRSSALSDARVLDALARELGVDLGCADAHAARAEIEGMPPTRSIKPFAPTVAAANAATPGAGEAVLATWPQLIDLGSLIDGDEYLAGTARPSVVRLSKGAAGALGVGDGELVSVSTDLGVVTLPARVTDMPDGVVWLPTNSPGATVRRTLGVTAGAVVSVSAGGTR